MQVESLYSNEHGPNSMSTEDFLRIGLPSLDRDVQERVSAASSRGKVLRYVCVIEGSRFTSHSSYNLNQQAYSALISLKILFRLYSHL